MIDKKIKSMNEVKVISHRRDFHYRGKYSFEMTHEELIDCCLEIYRGKYSFEMTHEELIDCCLEMYEFWIQSQADHLKSLDIL